MKQSDYLRALIDSRGIRPSQLAKKIGITTATMNRKIQGKVRFTERDITVILNELRMSYEDVFGNNENVVVTINTEKYIVSQTTASEISEILKKEVG